MSMSKTGLVLLKKNNNNILVSENTTENKLK